MVGGRPESELLLLQNLPDIILSQTLSQVSLDLLIEANRLIDRAGVVEILR